MSWMRRVFPLIGIVLTADVLIGAQPQPAGVEPPVLIKKDNKDDWIGRILFSPDGRYLLTAHRAPAKKLYKRSLPYGLGIATTGGLAIVKIWELPHGNLVRRLEVHPGDLNGWTMSDSGEVLATGSEAEVAVKLWEFPSGRLLHTIEGRNYPLRFSTDGARLWASYRYSFSVTPHGVKFDPVDEWSVWDVETGKLIAPNDRILLSDDVRVGAVDVKDGLEIRNTFSGGVVRQLPVPWTNRRDLSSDGSRLAVARGSEDDVSVEVWNTQTGERLWAEVAERPPAERPLAARSFFHLLGVPELVFSPDGATLIGWHGHDAAVRVWEVETGRQRSIGPSNRDREMQVRDVAFTGDGSLLAIHRSSELKTDRNPAAMPGPNSIGTVTFVRLPAFEPAGEITMQPDAAAFTIARDGSFVATRERDGTARLWRTPPLARDVPALAVR